MLDFIWILDGMKMHLKCIQGAIRVKHRWNFNETPMELGGAISVINIFLLG
jgi:hypothetical protein